LFELFDAVSYKGSILVTGFAGELVSIITSSDVMDFFKQQTIDSLYLEDIEKSIKDLVLYGFSDETESFCQEKLDDAIEEIHASEGSIKAKFEKAIRTYLGICDLPSKKINEEALNTSFFRLDIAKRKISFDELSLNEYIQLLTSSNRWDFYKDIFHASREAVRKRLEGIRDIRNQLAHYRGEITANQQKQLKRTSEWLNRCLIKFEETKTEIIDSSEFIEDQVIDEENSSEIKNSARSIYSPLAVYLNNLTYIDRIKLSFQEIEDILGFKLPKSAYTYRAWWANDNKTHSHSKEWLSAGWKVAYSNISNQEIDFKKIQGGGRKI